MFKNLDLLKIIALFVSLIQLLQSQICQVQGVQKYSIGSKSYDILCETGPGTKLWLVILSRFDGSVDFYKTVFWNDYVNNGVGNVNSQFFVSLQFLHQVTKNNLMELYVTMQEGSQQAWAYYQVFNVGDSSDNYVLTLNKYMSQSTAGDSLSVHYNSKFSTTDRDNDWNQNESCAQKFHGAFWYQMCHSANPLGQYGNNAYGQGINWQTFKGFNTSLDRIKFLIRPKQYGLSKLCLTDANKLITCIDCRFQRYAKTINNTAGVCVPRCEEYGEKYTENKENCYYQQQLCHPKCKTCNGLGQNNCLECAPGLYQDTSSKQKNTKTCVESCPVGTYKNDENKCLPCQDNCQSCTGCNQISEAKTQSMSNEYLVIFLIPMNLISLLILLFWRRIQPQDRRCWQNKIQNILGQNSQGKNARNVLYYHNMTLNQSKCKEYWLCVLAGSDLTFPALNLDMYFLRQIVAFLNITRGLVFLILNMVIYYYYNDQINFLNLLMSLIFLPIPFIYKLIAPIQDSSLILISKGLQKILNRQNNDQAYTNLNLKKTALKVLMVILGLLNLTLLVLIFQFNDPSISWILSIILIQFGSYVLFYMAWGLVCFIVKKKNDIERISRIPDWRVELVFQDLVLMSQKKKLNEQSSSNFLNKV